MIFVTLGTHGDPMPRIVRALERIAHEMPQLAPFEIQHGNSMLPTGWSGRSSYTQQEIESRMREAEIVITHGGPASIAAARAVGKIPIVVPRLARYREHVDDHQLWYARRLGGLREIVLSESDDDLPRLLEGYASITAGLPPARAHDPAAAIARFAVTADALLRR